MMEGVSWFSVAGLFLAYLARPSRSEPSDQVQGVTGTPAAFRSEFYEAYKRHAKIFDKELNVTLLFVSDPV